MNRRRRGAMLVLVLMSLTIAAALVTPLALLSGVEAVEMGRHLEAAFALQTFELARLRHVESPI